MNRARKTAQGPRLAVESLSERLGLYPQFRHAYQLLFNRPYLRTTRLREHRFAQLIGRGNLVFDIGANIGDYTDVFLRLGAKVIAVEPNPELAETLRRRYRRAEVEQVAVGANKRKATLHLGLNAAHSTTSADWRSQSADSARWTGVTLEVPLVTLETLIARHGVPSFVKIDTEGNDCDVLRGLQSAIPALSFECLCQLGVTPCLAQLQRVARYEFSLDHDEHFTWMAPDVLAAAVDEVCRQDREASFDVFARRVAP